MQGLSEPLGALMALLSIRPFLTPMRLQYMLAFVGGIMVSCVLTKGNHLFILPLSFCWRTNLFGTVDRPRVVPQLLELHQMLAVLSICSMICIVCIAYRWQCVLWSCYQRHGNAKRICDSFKEWALGQSSCWQHCGQEYKPIRYFMVYS